MYLVYFNSVETCFNKLLKFVFQNIIDFYVKKLHMAPCTVQVQGAIALEKRTPYT
jgi:hypothetical protein